MPRRMVKGRGRFVVQVTARRGEILRVVREVVAPLIQADRGELYLVNASDQSVTLHLAGRFSGCPGNMLARRCVIEPAITAVAPGAQVSITSGALIPKGAELIAGPEAGAAASAEPQVSP